MKQVHLLLLTRQHVVEREATGMLVLQVLELLEEHDVGDPAVAIQQRDGAARFAGEHRCEDREDRGNAASGGHHDVAARLCRVERRVEVSGRRDHLDDVTGTQTVAGVRGEHAVGEALDRDAKAAGAGAGADGIAAADVVAGLGAAEGDVLPVNELVVVGKLRRHLELDGDRVVGEGFHRGHTQRMQCCPPVLSRRLRWRRDHRVSAP